MKKYFYLIVATSLLLSCGINNAKKITASGTIETIETNISTKNADVVDKLTVNEGDNIKEGDTIAEIDHTLLDLQLKQAEAAASIAKYQLEMLLNGARTEDLQIAEQNLDQAKSNFETVEKNYQRSKELFKTGDISVKDMDDSENRYNTAKTQYNSAVLNLSKLKKGARVEELNAAKAQYDQATASRDLLKRKIDDCSIKSPVTGFVTDKFVEEGEFVNIGTPIYSIARMSPVNLTIYVSEQDLGRIRVGEEVAITIDSYRNRKFNGRIIFISPQAEFTPKNIQTKDERIKQVFAVKLEIPNDDKILKPGMPADAVIELK
jgi:HlyD family secretion protein